MNGAVSKTAVRSEINVTPLVDVCLVLLIVFMVITPIVCGGKTMVLLPATHSPERIKETSRQLTVAIREDGTVFVAQTFVPPGELAGLLRRLQETDPERPVIVEGDRRLQYQEVARLLATLAEAGFHRVGLITRSKL